MYMRLLYYANNARYKASGGEWVFRKWVEIRSRDLIKDMGKDRNAMRRVREELVKAGYIKYKPGIGNGTTEYMLCLLISEQRQEAKPTEAYRSLPISRRRKGRLIPTISLRRQFARRSVKTYNGEGANLTPPEGANTTTRRVQI